MKRKNIVHVHVITNLIIGLALWALFITAFWLLLEVPVIVKIITLPISLLVFGYISHRLIPKITVPVIERLFGEKEEGRS